MNRGGAGARSLNVELQAALNPAGDRKVERFGWIENDYDKEVAKSVALTVAITASFGLSYGNAKAAADQDLRKVPDRGWSIPSTLHCYPPLRLCKFWRRHSGLLFHASIHLLDCPNRLHPKSFPRRRGLRQAEGTTNHNPFCSLV
jgi:hypothetical protein